MNVLWLVYYGLAEPHIKKFDRKLELFNEFMVLLSFNALTTITEWNVEHGIKYDYAWITVGSMQMLTSVNIIIVLFQFKASIKPFIVKYFYLFKYFCLKKAN